MITALKRFEALYEPEPNSGCWLWRGHINKQGYGWFHMNGKDVRANRAAHQLLKGPIPDGLWVLHHCDNPTCVNPAHLFLGTRRDNMDDMVKKGRARGNRGETNGNSKLSPDIVRAILVDNRTQVAVAREYGIHHSTVGRLRAGRAWGHLSAGVSS